MTVLVTGTSSGFGLLTARTLIRKGYTVVATMRAIAGRNAPVAEELTRFASDNSGAVHPIELDVTDDGSVESAVGRALELTGKLDVVVNNAGIAVEGLAEAFTVDQLRRVLEVNVLGVQRVNRAVLPAMHEAGSGLLIHVSSVMGRIVIPFSAPYTASKWALEGLVESYRYELAGSGIDVAIVQPGAFGTGIAERLISAEDESRRAGYAAVAEVPEKIWGPMMQQLQAADAPDPQDVADAILQLIETPAGQRPQRTVVDPLTGGQGPSILNQTSERVQSQMFRAFGVEQLIDR